MVRITRMEMESEHVKARLKVSEGGTRIWSLFPNGGGFAITHCGKSLDPVVDELHEMNRIADGTLMMQDVADAQEAAKRKSDLVDFLDEQCDACEKGKGHANGA